MNSINALCGLSTAVVLQLGMLAGSAQTNQYSFGFTGSKTNITLNSGNYEITAYGAQGGANTGGFNGNSYSGVPGAEMAAGFKFTTATTLTLFVGGAGGSGPGPGGGGGGSFVVKGSTPLVVAGGGGGAGVGSFGGGDGPGGPGGAGSNGGNGGGYSGAGSGGSSGAGGNGGIDDGAGGGGGGYSGDGGSNGYVTGTGGGGGSYMSGGLGGFSYYPGSPGGLGGGGGGGFGSGGGGGGYSGGGGGGYSSGGGGGGGSIIDSSAVAIITEISGSASPDGSSNGEIIITAVSGPFLTNIVISPTNPIIAIGTNEAFAATGYFSDGSMSGLTLTNGLVWSSSNPGVATINTSGVVTGLAGGTTIITVTDGDVSGNATLTVLFPIGGPTNIYLFTGSEMKINLNPGTYHITAYGAQGGWNNYDYSPGGLGAEMEGKFNFAAPMALTLLVGGVGGGQGSGGGGGSFVVNSNTPLVIAGGGGGAGYYVGGDPGLTGTGGGGSNGTNGIDGNGGSGGGGFFSNGGIGPNGGANAGGGYSYLNGGGGGSGGIAGGGFGGGGGGWAVSGGGGGGYSGGAGAGGAGAGGGGGSYINSSAIAIVNEVSGIASPDDSQGNGEVIITTLSGPILTNIVISPANPIIGIDTNETFAATGCFSDGSEIGLAPVNGLVWSSSNTNVATINTNGVAQSLTGGTTTITATDGGIRASATLAVLAPLTTETTNLFLYDDSETNITLPPGTYDITAYGAQGGIGVQGSVGGIGAEIEGEFTFTTATSLTLLVGGTGASVNGGGSGGGGGGGGSFVANGNTLLVVAGGGGGGGAGGTGGNGVINSIDDTGTGAYGGGGGYFGGGGGSSFLDGGRGGGGAYGGSSGGFGGGGGGGFTGGGGGGGYSGGGGGGNYSGGNGGGSIIDSSAIAIITEVSGVASPNDPTNGEITIIAVPQPIILAAATATAGQFGFNVTGPTNATFVVQACTNLANPVWIPLATNTLNTGTNYFTDAYWTNYHYRFYRLRVP